MFPSHPLNIPESHSDNSFAQPDPEISSPLPPPPRPPAHADRSVESTLIDPRPTPFVPAHPIGWETDRRFHPSAPPHPAPSPCPRCDIPLALNPRPTEADPTPPQPESYKDLFVLSLGRVAWPATHPASRSIVPASLSRPTFPTLPTTLPPNQDPAEPPPRLDAFPVSGVVFPPKPPTPPPSPPARAHFPPPPTSPAPFDSEPKPLPATLGPIRATPHMNTPLPPHFGKPTARKLASHAVPEAPSLAQMSAKFECQISTKKIPAPPNLPQEFFYQPNAVEAAALSSSNSATVAATFFLPNSSKCTPWTIFHFPLPKASIGKEHSKPFGTP